MNKLNKKIFAVLAFVLIALGIFAVSVFAASAEDGYTYRFDFSEKTEKETDYWIEVEDYLKIFKVYSNGTEEEVRKDDVDGFRLDMYKSNYDYTFTDSSGSVIFWDYEQYAIAYYYYNDELIGSTRIDATQLVTYEIVSVETTRFMADIGDTGKNIKPNDIGVKVLRTYNGETTDITDNLYDFGHWCHIGECKYALEYREPLCNGRPHTIGYVDIYIEEDTSVTLELEGPESFSFVQYDSIFSDFYLSSEGIFKDIHVYAVTEEGERQELTDWYLNLNGNTSDDFGLIAAKGGSGYLYVSGYCDYDGKRVWLDENSVKNNKISYTVTPATLELRDYKTEYVLGDENLEWELAQSAKLYRSYDGKEEKLNYDIWYNTISETVDINKVGSYTVKPILSILGLSEIELPALTISIVCPGHDYDSKVTTEATCSIKQVETLTCKICGYSYTVTGETAPDKHVGQTYIAGIKQATCTESGYTGDIMCKDCNNKISGGEVTQPTGKHDLDGGKVTVTATCTTNGELLFKCKNCDYTKTKKTDKNPANHNGYAKELKNVKSATCTAEGYTGDKICKECGKTAETGKKTAKLDHTPKTIPAVAPTCTREGKSESIVCSVCNTVIQPAATIPVLDHSDNNGDGKCDDCGTDLGGSGSQSTGKTCKYCGQIHTGFWGKIVGFFHAILALFGLHK